jgi:asparagine synthase (glutamine-hydrolysing)
MCGFSGFLGFSNGNEAAVAFMSAAIAHCGADNGGVWVDTHAGITLAHRRLSILDPSPAGHQPMVSASGRYVIAFNGETCNHLDLRHDWKQAPFLPLSFSLIRRFALVLARRVAEHFLWTPQHLARTAYK